MYLHWRVLCKFIPNWVNTTRITTVRVTGGTGLHQPFIPRTLKHCKSFRQCNEILRDIRIVRFLFLLWYILPRRIFFPFCVWFCIYVFSFSKGYSCGSHQCGICMTLLKLTFEDTTQIPPNWPLFPHQDSVRSFTKTHNVMMYFDFQT
jgi:hypothetical protein